MSWMPRDLSSLCAVHTTVTNCAPSTFLFLQLITALFGGSRDNKLNPNPFYNFGHNNHAFGGHASELEYDFIVVGAGSAGCVVANRLTEIHHWRVLLLEAGDEEPEVAEVPAFAPVGLRSSIDWGYETQPSPRSCLARDGGRCPWARGKVMGGSSTLNYMIYNRGHPLDYDEWAAAGNPGWKFRDVLPYFRKSEDNRNYDRIDPYYHGFGGYQTVEIFPYQDSNVYPLIDAYKELGLEEFDQNTDRQIGTSLLQHTTRDGERLSTNGAFIRPIRNKRDNLDVRTNAQVTKVLIDPHNKIAIGVQFRQNGKVVEAYARKEVILSAGALNSPQILMLSGVGPADELQKFNIDVIQELAVGYNLQDHATMDGVLFGLNKTATTVTDEEREEDIRYYQRTRRGPLSSTGPLQVNAFVQTLFATGDRADIQYSLDATDVRNFITDPVLTAATAVTPLAYYDGIMVRPILLNPKSRGVVRLNYSDPEGAPLLFANTFQEQQDLLTMVEGVKQSLNLLRTHSLGKLGYQLVDVPLPDCTRDPFGSDEYWQCCAMSYTTTIYHPVGTCKMGPKNDKSAVVDAKLRVYGIKNLRVIDASIMPTIIRGNTNAPVIMIAEKGSDLIKHAWLKENIDLHSLPPPSSYQVSENEYH